MTPRTIRHALVAAGLACMATPALADPITLVANAILWLAGPGAWVVGITAQVAYVAATAIVAGAAYGLMNRSRRRARDAFNASLRDRTMTVRGATEPRRVVLGRQRVGGVVAFIGSAGANKEQLVMVIALAAHEIDAIEAVYFNDEAVSIVSEYVETAPYGQTAPASDQEYFTGGGSQTAFTLSRTPLAGTVFGVQGDGGDNSTSRNLEVASVVGAVVTFTVPPDAASFYILYQYSATSTAARVRPFLGGPGQTVDSVVQALFPTEWDSAHAMAGCAGLALFFNYNEDAYPSGLPNVSAVVRGAKVYDPRLDTTAGGSGAHRLADPTTWQWSESPPLLIGYYAMSELGGRLPSTAIRWSDIAAAANVCDQQVDYSTWGLLATDGGDVIGDESGNPIGV